MSDWDTFICLIGIHLYVCLGYIYMSDWDTFICLIGIHLYVSCH